MLLREELSPKGPKNESKGPERTQKGHIRDLLWTSFSDRLNRQPKSLPTLKKTRPPPEHLFFSCPTPRHPTPSPTTPLRPFPVQQLCIPSRSPPRCSLFHHPSTPKLWIFNLAHALLLPDRRLGGAPRGRSNASGLTDSFARRTSASARQPLNAFVF